MRLEHKSANRQIGEGDDKDKPQSTLSCLSSSSFAFSLGLLTDCGYESTSEKEGTSKCERTLRNELEMSVRAPFPLSVEPWMCACVWELEPSPRL